MDYIMSRPARKFLRKITDKDIKRIIEAIKKLPAGDIDNLTNWNPSSLRLRVGDYRVIFRVCDGVNHIGEIGNRGDVYKK